MSTIGIIYTAFNTGSDYLTRSLSPWVEARRTHLDGHTFLIAAVSVPFIGFEHDSVDNTQELLLARRQRGDIDHAIISTTPTHETAARGEALRWLAQQGAELTWQVDADEFYTLDQINSILAFIHISPVTWWRLSLKNRVFDAHTYLVDPFTPPRIHRTRLGDFITARAFWDDNNVEYWDVAHAESVMDRAFAHLTIPTNVAWIEHYTWLNDERSRAKVRYQEARNWCSSFAWDDTKGGLIWNTDYWRGKGLPFPDVARD